MTVASAVSESHRDHGLVRALGTWGLAASILSIVVGAGIFAVPAALAASIGSYAPLAFLLCAVAIGSVAICFAEGGSRIPTSGGAYGYIEVAFGPLTGYVSGTLLWFGDALACGGVAAALADVAVSMLPPAFKMAAHAAVIVVVVGFAAAANIRGVSHAGRLINAATALKLIPLALFVMVGATAMHASNFTQTVQPNAEGFGRAVILALFALTGMEDPLSASGEVAQPARTIPRALGLAMFFVTLLYVAIQLVAQGILGSSLGGSTAPLADAMARIGTPWRLLMLTGAALSMFGYVSSDLLGTPRMLFAFARDGFLPRALARVHTENHTPHIAILCYAVLTMILALTGTFAELAVLATLATAVLYMAGCAAAWKLARRGVALAGDPLSFRWLPAAAATGIASMLVLIALGSRTEILGLLATVGVSGLIYQVVFARRGQQKL
jgi:APA family basic amino acid/polyamine antiporter